MTIAAVERSERLPQPPLRTFLFSSVQDIHREALRNPFLLGLSQGRMGCSKAYVVYLCNLYWLHKALESAQEKIREKYGEGHFVFPVLYRSSRLLIDIKLWSIFNPTASLFASQGVRTAEYLENIRHFVQPSAHSFVQHLEDLTREDPLLAIAAMYILYGTLMSGGQIVKRGVQKAFLERLQEAREYGPLTPNRLIDKILKNEDLWAQFAEDSVSFFSFTPLFDIVKFKGRWHDSLNQLDGAQERLSLESQETMRVVLDIIASFHDQLERGVI